GFVVPAIEHRRIIAASFSSFKFEGRAPAGAILARAFIGGELHREMMNLSDDQMVAAVRDEFRALLGVTAAPGIAVVRRWPDAMPQYDVGHLARVAEIERLIAPIPAFAIAGAAYRGVGSPDCVRSGEAAADTIFSKRSRLWEHPRRSPPRHHRSLISASRAWKRSYRPQPRRCARNRDSPRRDKPRPRLRRRELGR